MKFEWMRRIVVATTLVLQSLAAQGSVLVDEATLVSSSPAREAAAPPPRDFDVATAGAYTLTLTDQAFPAPFTALELVVTVGSRVVARLEQPGSVTFDAAAGTHTVRVLGATATAGQFAVNVVSQAGGGSLFDWVGTIDNDGVPPVSGNCTNGTEFTIAAAGSYALTLVDRAFPGAFGTLAASIVAQGGGSLIAQLGAPGASAPFAAATGAYCLFVIANPVAPATRGLYSVSVASGSTLAYGSTAAVGDFGDVVSIDLPASGSYTLTATDLGFPAPLQSLAVALVQGPGAAVVTGPGSSSLPGVAGEARLYALATSASPGAGTYGVSVTGGGSEIYGDVVAVDDGAAGGPEGFTFAVDLPAAGAYQLRLTDFRFPQALGSVLIAMNQGPNLLGSSSSAGTLDVNAAAGRATIVVAAEPAAGAGGLFGVSLQSGSAPPVIERTQGVGGAFTLRQVAIPAAGSYDVALADLRFPAAFGEVALAVTRGSTLIGQIIGTGEFSFDATAGDYAINLIATLGPGENYGLYGVEVADTPPAPTVTIRVDPATVQSGGTVSVTWSSTNADACNASGGWSGSRATAGTQSGLGPIAANTTLTLTCTGPGGAGSASATVNVAAATGGGGGATSPWFVAGLLGLAAALARCARPSASREGR